MPYNPDYEEVTINSGELADSVKQEKQNSNIDHILKYVARLGDGANGNIKIAMGQVDMVVSSSDVGSVTIDMDTDAFAGFGIQFEEDSVFYLAKIIHPGGTLYNLTQDYIALSLPWDNKFVFFCKFASSHSQTYPVNWIAIGVGADPT